LVPTAIIRTDLTPRPPPLHTPATPPGRRARPAPLRAAYWVETKPGSLPSDGIAYSAVA